MQQLQISSVWSRTSVSVLRAASDSMLALRLAEPFGAPPLGRRLRGASRIFGLSVGAHAAKDMDREDTTSLLQGYGIEKGARTMSSPGSGPRHTIDHILGLARRDEVDCRADTPGTGTESAGKSSLHSFVLA